jgi:uncharacterized protein YcbX
VSDHVAGLWRYPVKSLLGENCSSLRFVADGIAGDRMWGIQDCNDGRILRARREPRLLFAASRVGSDGLPIITLPDAQETSGLGVDIRWVRGTGTRARRMRPG